MVPHLFYLVEAIQYIPYEGYNHWPVRLCLTLEEAEQTLKIVRREFKNFDDQVSPLAVQVKEARRSIIDDYIDSTENRLKRRALEAKCHNLQVELKASMSDRNFDNPDLGQVRGVGYRITVLSDDFLATAEHWQEHHAVQDHEE